MNGGEEADEAKSLDKPTGTVNNLLIISIGNGSQREKWPIPAVCPNSRQKNYCYYMDLWT